MRRSIPHLYNKVDTRKNISNNHPTDYYFVVETGRAPSHHGLVVF